jgi:hypothetical protein
MGQQFFRVSGFNNILETIRVEQEQFIKKAKVGVSNRLPQDIFPK